ncbi:MAG: glycosyltransferase family 39 protein [Gemmatimonadota bacterium]|nr:glycosyltransferase family 39 protein [Gemmatimonadota bacterium]
MDRNRRASDARRWRTALLVTAGATLLRLVFAALLPLFPDETYYWDWSRGSHLAAGYFDHPPMIAVLVRAGTSLFTALGVPPSPLAVRFFAVLAGGMAALAASAIARRLAGGLAARTAAIVFAVMPLAASGLVLATPDAPLLAASAVGLYCVVRALESPGHSGAALLWWSAAGVALGLAFASKYTSILLPITITAAVLIRPSLRARLREPGPYLACVLATLVFLPVIQWNAAHEWISFRFQLQHGLGAPKGSAIKRELDLIGGQLALVSPILFALGAYSVWNSLRRTADDIRFALAVVAVGSWLFFVYSALRRSVEANWPAPSYIPGVALLASMYSSPGVSRAWRRWVNRGIALAAVMVAVIYVHALAPILPLLPARRDPLARSAGWDRVGTQVSNLQSALTAGSSSRAWVAADRYQEVSELAFHSAGRPTVFCLCLSGRHNQYDLWPGFAQTARPGDALIALVDERPDSVTHETVARLAPYFSSVQRDALAPLLRGRDTVTVRRLWVLQGWRGGWPARTEWAAR